MRTYSLLSMFKKVVSTANTDHSLVGGGDLLDRLTPLIASMATLALISGLRVRLLLIGGSPDKGQYSASPQRLTMGPVKKN
jgi:hypothetical protein